MGTTVKLRARSAAALILSLLSLLSLAAPTVLAQPVRPNYPQLANLPVVEVESFGAKGTDTVDDGSAIQNAINAAALRGGPTYKGAIVHFPPGDWTTNQVLILPRSGNDLTPVVQLVGDGGLASMLVQGPSFPPGRATVEWEAVTDTALHQRIAHLGFRTRPGIAGTKAIWHKSNKVGGLQAAGTTLANVMAEWLTLDLEDIYCEGNNQDNEVFIDLEVGDRFANIWKVRADPWRGTPPAGQQPAYDTLLLRTAYQWAGVDPPQNEDSVGLYQCDIRDLQPMILQGGWVRCFQGRINSSSWIKSFSNGPNPGSTGIGYEFRNCFQTTLSDLASEGGGGRAQFLFYNCRGVTGHNLGVPVGAASQQSPWLASHAYNTVGERVVPTLLVSATAQSPANRVYTVTTAGTSGGTEPAWNDTGTTTSGTVTFTASSGFGAADGVVLQSCEGCTFDKHYADPGSSPPSFRRTKAVSIDANSRNNRFEGWAIRGLVSGGSNTVNTDILPEVTVLGQANSVSGDLVQAFNNYRLPFLVGLDAQRLDAVTNYRGDDNLLEVPAAFDNALWVKTAATVTADVAADPIANAQRVDKIVESATSAQHSVVQSYARGAVAKQQTFSIYLKSAERTTAALYLTDGTGFLKLACDMAAGSATASVFVAETGMTLDGSSVTNVGNGWYRFRITGTLPAATSTTFCYVFPNTNTTYAGNGTSGIYAFGAQLENASDAGAWREPNPTLFVGVDAPVQRMDAGMRAARTITLSTAGAYNGAWFEIVQSGGGAFTRDVGGLKTIPASTNAKIRATYDGSAWRLTDYAADTDALIATKSAVGHTHTLSNITDAGTAAARNVGIAVSNLVEVKSDGKIDAGVVPSIPATHVYVVASQAAMLALSGAVVGDIAKRTDLGTSFVLQTAPPSVLGNWVTITDASSVTTVNGLSGAVVLTTTNINEGTNLYYTTGRVNTDAPNATLSAGADAFLSLTGQQIGVDNFGAHTFLRGPTSGGAAAPTVGILDATDLPSHVHAESDVTNLVTDLANKVTVGDFTAFDTRYYTKAAIDANLPNVTLAASADTLLGITGQQLSLDSQTQGLFLMSPSAAPGAPTFRSPLLAEIPSSVFGTGTANATTWLNGGRSWSALPVSDAVTQGIVELATAAEATAQTDNVRAVTPLGLADRMKTNWTLTPTAPLTGGGDGSANRSLGITAATSAAAGSMSAADKAKVDGINTFVNAGTVTTNYTPDAAAADVYEITLGAATVTINAPTNPTNGRKVLYRLKQDATGNRAVTWNAVFTGGIDIPLPLTLSTAPGKMDYVGTVYDGAAAHWNVIAITHGY